MSLIIAFTHGSPRVAALPQGRVRSLPVVGARPQGPKSRLLLKFTCRLQKVSSHERSRPTRCQTAGGRSSQIVKTFAKESRQIDSPVKAGLIISPRCSLSPRHRPRRALAVLQGAPHTVAA